MSIQSDPPGALVYLNDHEIGRTPVKTDFEWYGNYEIELRLDGHKTLKTTQWVVAPFWNWIPFDLVAAVQPMRLKDEHYLYFKLQTETVAEADPGELLKRGQQMKTQLESSQFTRNSPTTKPN